MKLISTALICVGFIASYSQGMNSEDLFKYALENSPTIKNRNLDVDMAEQQIKQALTYGYPKINGSLSFQNFIDIPTTVVPAAAFNPMAPTDELLGLQFGTDYNANYSLQLDQLIFSFSYLYGVQTAKSYKRLTELIKLKSYDHNLVDKSAEKIVKTVKTTGAIVSGPIPLPTHKRIYTVLRSPHVNKKAREQFQLCAYKRLMDIYSSSSKTIDALMKLELLSGVVVEIKV